MLNDNNKLIFRAFLHKLIVGIDVYILLILKDVRGFLSMETIVWLVPPTAQMLAVICPLGVVSIA